MKPKPKNSPKSKTNKNLKNTKKPIDGINTVHLTVIYPAHFFPGPYPFTTTPAPFFPQSLHYTAAFLIKPWIKQVVIHSRQGYTFKNLHTQFPVFLWRGSCLMRKKVFGGSWELWLPPGAILLRDPSNSPTNNEHNEHGVWLSALSASCTQQNL